MKARRGKGRPCATSLAAEPATDGYHYSPNFASADFVWDDHTLDAWLVNPQAVIAGATMASAGEACRSCGYHLVSQGTALNGQTCPLHDPRFR